ncbi:copper homeostasis protein cutC homolog [Lucilia sericata]|uniref:copper homeostasis protein cutC homolog n=1 Tax=Lucilia sericata TaxID=13632 RepID=UPI0018A878A3|nr:copper homeostasis protein cutC homolog [Lucilia sericata]
MSSSHNIKLEVCVDSIASAIAAAEGGAARLELCSALSEGGLTPSVGILKALKDLPLTIPIFCMLRPRRGHDFVYTELEMSAILHDMDLLLAEGADGFVFGALTAGREINTEQCQQVVEKAKGLPLTFHRAFDVTNPEKMDENVELIIDMGFKRLLSSGFRQTAEEGLDYLCQLIAKHHKDITIMPGAGVNVTNLEEILTTSKCTEFHASAKAAADNTEDSNNVNKMECEVSMGKADVLPYDICDKNVVRKMVTIAKAMAAK